MTMVYTGLGMAGASILGGMMQSSAIGSAADAQRATAQQATDTQWRMFLQQQQQMIPWLWRGNAAGNQLAYLMGLPGYGSLGTAMGGGRAAPPQMSQADKDLLAQNPQYLSPENLARFTLLSQGQNAPGGQQDMYGEATFNPSMGTYGSLATPFSQTNWQADPGYAFRLAEGQKALERSASAKGMSLSGAQQKALTSYGQGMGSQEYMNSYNRYNTDQSNLFNRLSGISGTGQQQSQALGTMGMNTAGNIGNIQTGLGNALGASALAQGNAWGGMANQLGSMWNNYNAWNQMGGGMGGYGYGYTGNPYNPYGTTGMIGTDGAWASGR